MAARRLTVLAALLVLLIAFVLAPTQGQTPTDAPTTSAPATDAPTTSAPATDAPATNAPTTSAPTTDTPATTTPTPTTSSPTNSTMTPTPTPTSSNSTSTPTPTPTASACGPRVRRDWRQLSVDDKQLYRDAIKAAMTSKYHTLFQEILTDKDTCNEAYLTSASVYWHRRFLLAYENMLRSLEPRFACITIPYWDMFSDYTNQVTNITNPVTNITGPVCTTMEQCSTFLGEFGGSSGAATKVSINGYNITTTNPDGNCVNGLLSRGRNASEINNNYADFSNFCENSANGTTCSGCIPRGPWNSTLLPTSITSAQLLRVVKPSYGFYYFSNSMMNYFQSPMHNTLNSTMATCATAADPMFYSLQATLDLVHQLYYDCQIGANLTDAQKQSSSSTYVYQAYTLASSVVSAPSVTANMTMYWNSTVSSQRMRADDHPLLKQFFAPLPNQFWYYASINDLGNNSYSYSPDTLISLLAPSLATCPKNRVRRLREQAQDRPGSVHAAGTTTTPAPTPSPTPTPTLGSSDEDSSNSTVVVPDGVILATANPTDRQTTKSVVKCFNYFQAVMANVSDFIESEIEALEVTAIADCVLYHSQFKKVDDFSPRFLEEMGLPNDTHTFCYDRLKNYAGDSTIPVDFRGLQKQLVGMNDTQLANLPSITVGAAVVPVTAFQARTIADVAKPDINSILDAAVTSTSAA